MSREEADEELWSEYGRGEGDEPQPARRRALPDDPVPAIVRGLRRRSNLSQRALATAAGVSPGTVRRAENGQDVGVTALRRLLHVGGLELACVARTPVTQHRGALARHLEVGCTTRMLDALCAEDPTGGLRGHLVRLARRAPATGPETGWSRWVVAGRLAAGTWLPPDVLGDAWPRGTGAADMVRERRAEERPVPVVVPDRVGAHRWSQHVLLPVLGPADLADAPSTPREATGLLHLADALLALGAAGDRADRRPSPHRLPEPPRRVEREWADDLTRWRPPDDPCDGSDHRLGGPRAA